MKYIIVDIPTMYMPSERYKLTDKLYVFPSKRTTNNNIISENDTFLSLLIISEFEEFDHMYFKSKVKEFVLFLNFLTYDVYSAKWIVNINFRDFSDNFLNFNSLNEAIDTNIGNEIEYKKSQFYNYNKMPLSNYYRYESSQRFNIVDLFNRYISLSKDNILRHQIELLSFINVEQQLVNRFYDNGNVEISLLYTLLDSIMDDVIGKEPVIKICSNCGYETKGKKKDKRRIKEFCKNIFDDNQEYEKLFTKIIMNFYEIRNSFFHEGLNESSQEIIMKGFTKKKEETGDALMSIEEEVGYSQSRNLGKLNVKSLIGQLLIERLLKT